MDPNPAESATPIPALPEPASMKPKRKPRVSGPSSTERDNGTSRLADGAILLCILALTFLLGAFRQKDMDIWWHLRTGRWIREHSTVPRVDFLSFGAAEHPWIDLHWGFEVVASLIYDRGGMVALQLAKCGVTTLALLLLIGARRRAWPIWGMALAWLPALVLLGGRMYVRPETLTLLWLSIFLAVLFRIRGHPKLLWILPFVQVLWVNTQGLFVLGPIVLALALADAALSPGSFSEERRDWRRTVISASGATLAACLVNPWFIEGALFPWRLAETMANPVFSNSIDELTPIPTFVSRNGFGSFMLRLHMFVMAFGALSFVGLAIARAMFGREERPAGKSKNKKAREFKNEYENGVRGSGWIFRLLLYLAFSVLSLRATRNSHQFAAVVGALTAWNVGESLAVWKRGRFEPGKSKGLITSWGLAPRSATLIIIAVMFTLVGSGLLYRIADEGRTIGLGEERLWHPHEAAKFAGSRGMPDRLIAYHLGDAGLYEFYHGPERKAWVDPRLEVMGPELYESYMELGRRIGRDESGWERTLERLGSPAILVDDAHQFAVGATLLAHPNWPCVWFDPIASVFAPRKVVEREGIRPVDFLARHFRPDPKEEPDGTDALLAEAKALASFAAALNARPSVAGKLIPLGLDRARRVLRGDPDSIEGWKALGRLEAARIPALSNDPSSPVSRISKPFDPVLDLAFMKASFRLAHVLNQSPDDSLSLSLLSDLFRSRGFDDAALPLFERLARVAPSNPVRKMVREMAKTTAEELRRKLGPEPRVLDRPNPAAVERELDALLARGRACAAADLIEASTHGGARDWAKADRLATSRLNLGRPDSARQVWIAASAPRPALRSARIGATWLVEGDFDRARGFYRDAIAAEPELFEALYGMATLEFDAGRALEAASFANRAAKVAPGTYARSHCLELAKLAEEYVPKKRDAR